MLPIYKSVTLKCLTFCLPTLNNITHSRLYHQFSTISPAINHFTSTLVRMRRSLQHHCLTFNTIASFPTPLPHNYRLNFVFDTTTPSQFPLSHPHHPPITSDNHAQTLLHWSGLTFMRITYLYVRLWQFAKCYRCSQSSRDCALNLSRCVCTFR
jgi:hypothetical protein